MKRPGINPSLLWITLGLACLYVLAPLPSRTQGIAPQYRKAAQQHREWAARTSGAQRQCNLEWASYYDCLADNLGPGGGSLRCRRPTCDPGAGSTGSQPGSGSGSQTGSSSSGLGGAIVDLIGGLLSNRRQRERERALREQQRADREVAAIAATVAGASAVTREYLDRLRGKIDALDRKAEAEQSQTDQRASLTEELELDVEDILDQVHQDRAAPVDPPSPAEPLEALPVLVESHGSNYHDAPGTPPAPEAGATPVRPPDENAPPAAAVLADYDAPPADPLFRGAFERLRDTFQERIEDYVSTAPDALLEEAITQADDQGLIPNTDLPAPSEIVTDLLADEDDEAAGTLGGALASKGFGAAVSRTVDRAVEKVQAETAKRWEKFAYGEEHDPDDPVSKAVDIPSLFSKTAPFFGTGAIRGLKQYLDGVVDAGATMLHQATDRLKPTAKDP